MDLKHTFSAAVKNLGRNPVLAVPSLAGMTVVVLLSVATIGGAPLLGTETARILSDGLAPEVIGFGSGLAVLGFLGVFFSFLAHGLTVGMTEELLSSGATSLATSVRLLRERTVDILLVSIIAAIAVSIGFKLLFVPGLLVAYGLVFTYPIVIREGSGAIGAVRESVAVVINRPAEAGGLFAGLLGVHVLAWLVSSLCWGIPVLGKVVWLLLSGAAGGFVGVSLLLGYEELLRTEIPDESEEEEQTVEEAAGDESPPPAPPRSLDQ